MRKASFRINIAIPFGFLLLSILVSLNWSIFFGAERDMFRLLWTLYGLLGIALYFATVWYIPFPIHKPPDAENQNRQETDLPAVRTQDSVISAKRALGYGEPIWIDTRDENGIPNRILPKSAVQSKIPRRTRKDIAFQEISLTRPDSTDLVLTAMVLFDSKSWKKGRYDLLQGESPQGISPVKSIRKSDLKADIQDSLALYCVGLASTEFELSQAHDNTVLSDNRAISLCNSLHELGYVDSANGKRTVAVGLGERNQDPDDKTPQARQRAAVIIAAKQLDSADTERDVVDAFTHGLDIVSVSLTKYTRSDDAVFKMYDVTGPVFCEASSDDWEDKSGLTRRLVLCAEPPSDSPE